MALSIVTKLSTMLGIWGLRDAVEILFMSAVLYYLSRWLASHVTRKLVTIMYGYCLLIIGSYCLALPFIFSLLVTAAPIACIILILMHQDTLQRNFIVPKQIIPACREQSWVEALIQSCMIECAENKDIIVVIQRHDDISSFITTGCPVKTLLHKNLLLALMQSATFDVHSFIYIQNDGTLVGINGSFGEITDKIMPEAGAQLAPSWQDHALSLSAKTDVLILQSNHLSSTFTIIMRGAITHSITAHACTQLITDYVQDSSISKKGFSHDIKSTHTQSSGQHRA